MSYDSQMMMEEYTMSILTTQTSDTDQQFVLFGDRVSTSFIKRETKYFKPVPTENKKVKKEYEEFCTGSSYIGEWNIFGFCGHGTYIYPHGVEYEGRFNKVGQYHGLGTLTYPNGQKMHGVWKNGKLFEYAYVFNCGEELDEYFTYCQMPDRRFHVEIRKYFGPSGQEYLTADQPTRDLPKGCYDTVDGIYNPKYKFILSHNTCDDDASDYFLAPQIKICKRRLSQEYILKGRVVKEIPTEDKIKWIKENCRKAWDEPTGYRPDLYENWNAGRRREPKYFDFTKSTTNLKQTDNYYHEIPYKDSKLYSFIKKVKKPHLGRLSIFERLHSIHSSV